MNLTDLMKDCFEKELSLNKISKISGLPESWVLKRLKDFYPKNYRVKELEGIYMDEKDKRINIIFKEHINKLMMSRYHNNE